MVGMSHKVTQWISGLLALPHDILLSEPRLTMIGSKKLYIENHCGVIHFSPNRIVFAVGEGKIQIDGSDLMIRAIISEEVTVEGNIFTINLNGVEE